MYCRVEQVTDYNIAQAHCVLDTYGTRARARVCVPVIIHKVMLSSVYTRKSQKLTLKFR